MATQLFSEDDKKLYDEFEAEGFTREELKAINAIAPAGQRLQDAALLNGLEEVDDLRIRPTGGSNGLGKVEERGWRGEEKREGKGKKRKRKKKRKGTEQDSDRVSQEAGNPSTNKYERRIKRKRTTEESDGAPKRKKTAAQLEQEHWRKIERPPRDNKEDQEKQDHIAAIDDEIRGTRDFANAKQLEIWEHGGMPEIDNKMKQDLEEMKKDRDTLREGEELNKRNRKKSKSVVRNDGTVGSKHKRQWQDAFSTTDEAADLTPAAKALSPSPDPPSTNTRSSSRRQTKPPPPPPSQPTSPPLSATAPLPPPSKPPTKKPPRRSSTKISPYFPTSPAARNKPPRPSRKNISCIPHPPLSSPIFGLAQERLAHTPFHLLLACVFLTKTRGAVSIPVFYRFISRYPTALALAEAEVADVVPWFEKLGLQNQRAKRVVGMARAWVAEEPRRGRRWVVGRKKGEWLGDDDDDVEAKEDGGMTGPGGEQEEGGKEGGKVQEAYEIAHIPGIGAYGLDSWRIFCRDELRGITTTDTHTNASTSPKPGVSPAPAPDSKAPQPEWQRVLPLDKELRAYLRWRWLKEGWVWDPLSGEKRRARPEEIEEAEGGGVMVEGDEGEEGKWKGEGKGKGNNGMGEVVEGGGV